MGLLDGSRIAEFLDANRNQPISVRNIEEEDTVSKLCVKRKFKKRQNIVKRFLIATLLYRVNGDKLIPYLIKGHWQDYAAAWKKFDDEIHQPFLSKVAFLCNKSAKRVWVCHPKTSASVEKIYVEEEKSLTRSGIYSRNKFDRLRQLNSNVVKYDEFIRLLRGFRLAKRLEGRDYQIGGEKGILHEELGKLLGEYIWEKAARLFLRRDFECEYYHLTHVITMLENRERQTVPYKDEPIGTGAGAQRESNVELKGLTKVWDLNNPEAHNIVRCFTQFETFLEWYRRDRLSHLERVQDHYLFLSWYTDPLGFIQKSMEGQAEKCLTSFIQNKNKIEKLNRHSKYIYRFIGLSNKAYDLVASQKKLQNLHQKLRFSEFLNMNPREENLRKNDRKAKISNFCPFNLYVISKVPMKAEEFKKEILDILENEKTFRDAQGAFFYPDFRFIASSSMGYSLKEFDETLAYLYRRDAKFRTRLWFFPSFGAPKIRKQRIEKILRTAVMEPFDHIALRY